MSDLDARIQSFVDQHAVLGASVALVRDGAICYQGGFGTTSVEDHGVRVTPETLFTYGSICKTLCATLVMRLVERGLLALDTPIVAYLPDVWAQHAASLHQPTWARLTLRHVLSHTTGLPAAGKDWGPRDPDSLERFVYEQLPHYAFLSEPGAVHLYSSTVFCLAGYLAEVVTGRYFDDLMREYVFEPLDMRGVTYDPAVAMTYPVALPHERDADGTLRVFHRMTYNASGNPSSFGYGRAADLANLALMYLNEGRFGGQRFLTAASIAEMQRMHISRRITSAANAWAHVNEGYGLGFSVGQYRGRRAARHGGMNLSCNCFFELFPDDRAGVVLLTNQCDEERLLELVVLLYDEVLALPHQGMVFLPPPAPRPPPHDLQRYVGTYICVGSGDVATVSAAGQELIVERQGQAAALVSIGDDEFYCDVSATQRVPVAFVSSADGRVTNLLIGGEPHQRFTVDRMAQPPQVQVYEGVYKDPSNSNRDEILTVRADADTLVIAQGGQEYRCAAVGGECFVSALGMVEFVPSQAGAASILVLGKATRYYPLDAEPYRSRGVISYLVNP